MSHQRYTIKKSALTLKIYPADRLSDNALLVKAENQARALAREPPQLDSQPRSEDSDWEALVKYGMRKIERFVIHSIFKLIFQQM